MDDESYNSGNGKAYDFYGVNPKHGAIVIVRPDQCEFLCLTGRTLADNTLDVSMVIPFEEDVEHKYQVIGNFFLRFCKQVQAASRGGL